MIVFIYDSLQINLTQEDQSCPVESQNYLDIYASKRKVVFQ